MANARCDQIAHGTPALPKSIALVVLGALLATPVRASPALARAHNCLNCHQIERKVVGPSYRDVAARYAGDTNAEARLAEKIRLGGSGAWGAVPMPANAVSADEARTLAHWILTLK